MYHWIVVYAVVATLSFSAIHVRAVTESPVSNVFKQVSCETVANCPTSTLPYERAGLNYEIRPVSCVNSTCVCASESTIYATVHISHMNVHVGSPDFAGFHTELEKATICAPKAGKRCIGGLCAPGAYCIYDSKESWGGTCGCIPGTVLSPTTGLCECPNDWSLNEDGVCVGRGLGGSCSDNKDCGFDPSSGLLLECVNETCSCASLKSSLAYSVRSSSDNVHKGNPDFQGYDNTTIEAAICLPSAGFSCVLKGYCAPGSYCVYDALTTWKGSCACIPGTRYSPATGLCECPGNATLTDDGVCPGAEVHERCESNDDCGIEALSMTKLVCVNGTCECNPESHTFASTRTSHTAVHRGSPWYLGYDPTRYEDSSEMCVPKAKKPCIGKGYCAPKSYCIYKSPSSWSGTCTCIPHSVYSNATRHCECKTGYRFNQWVNECEDTITLDSFESFERDSIKIHRRGRLFYPFQHYRTTTENGHFDESSNDSWESHDKDHVTHLPPPPTTTTPSRKLVHTEDVLTSGGGVEPETSWSTVIVFSIILVMHVVVVGGALVWRRRRNLLRRAYSHQSDIGPLRMENVD